MWYALCAADDDDVLSLILGEFFDYVDDVGDLSDRVRSDELESGSEMNIFALAFSAFVSSRSSSYSFLCLYKSIHSLTSSDTANVWRNLLSTKNIYGFYSPRLMTISITQTR